MEVDDTRLPQDLAKEVFAFTKECYSEANTKRPNNFTLTEAQYHDIGWIGSQYYLTEPGYYDKIQSQSPRQGWPFKESRDATFFKHETGPLAGAGYPSCKEWWENKTIGLRERIINTVEPTLWVKIKKWTRWSSAKEAEEETLRQLVKPSHLQRTNDIGEYMA